ncbi:3'-5' exonuclease [Rhizobium wenxiniae]|uniref:3'-5' exonuclease n=1 Tax=Rhizobium wenxiniae TaxID=1737357 RepID=UPI003C1FBDAE
MTKFTDLMIDLETLGNKVNAPIFAIGAVYFNPETGELGETFEGAIDLEDAMRYGKPDGSTIKWWLGQGDSARQKAIRGRHTSVQVFEAFYSFCGKHGSNVCPWGNGATFDISMLEYSFGRILDKTAPWKFWNIQDCRTIKRVAGGIVNYDGQLEGTAHTALDDAIHQAKYVSCYWQGLRGKKAATVEQPKPAPALDLIDL